MVRLQCAFLFNNDRQYPIGVMFDLLGSPDNLPWRITVHFQVQKVPPILSNTKQGFPHQTLLRCSDETSIKSLFMNTLKEVTLIGSCPN
jgi:hypothetical protein